ncbi:MAG: trehalose-6-phosphate synthase [Alphaproteobacteria bacterium]|nr:trehalose-6-phosphate synthase [Alphaproteobacteria bacterium]
MARLIVVSNRIPAPRQRGVRSGGLEVGLRDAVRQRGGIWFGWSGATAAETSLSAQISDSREAVYATIDLSAEDYRKYYVGFANSTLWPLFHYRLGLMEFQREELAAYMAVNEAFARALAPLLLPDDLIWIHDYHLIPCGAALRRLGVLNRIGFFLHVPCPPSAVFGALPCAATLLRSLSAYDVVGVQTPVDLRGLLDCLEHIVGARFVGEDLIRVDGKLMCAIAVPMGIDTAGFAAQSQRALHAQETRRLKDSLANRDLIIGVERLDYSKGLPNRFKAYARLLKRFPEHCGKVTFLQVAARSRVDVEQYRALRRELDRLAGRVNGDHAEFDWMPLRYITRDVPRAVLAGFYRCARVGLVTPLRDGMNLVAKEYVAAQDGENPGVLILSHFAGAAQRMTGAVQVNPLDPDEIAEAMHLALSMPQSERQARWHSMMETLRVDTAQAWSRNFLQALSGESQLRDEMLLNVAARDRIVDEPPAVELARMP